MNSRREVERRKIRNKHGLDTGRREIRDHAKVGLDLGWLGLYEIQVFRTSVPLTAGVGASHACLVAFPRHVLATFTFRSG